jgi:hypothetical protein
MCVPGFTIFTKDKPMPTANKVVVMYANKVFHPKRPNLETSRSPDTPPMIENNTKGTAMNFKSRIKIIPNGSIQRIVNSFQPMKLDTKAHITPSTRPMTILT